MKPLKPQLQLLTLEDRVVPALFGNVWPNPGNLTVGIARDGTDIAGVQSNLNSLLSSTIDEATWKSEISRAFQSWASVTNVDVRYTFDWGSAFGSTGSLQSSWSAGDIRIGARPLSSNVIAVTNPPDLISGWSGEIILNSNYKFSVGGAKGTIDLYTAVVHEAGHALGLDDGIGSTSVINDYNGPVSGLSAIDVSAIQSLYGVRVNDVYEGSKNNNTTGRATLMGYISSSKQIADAPTDGSGTPFLVNATINSGDVDHYKFTLPTGASDAVVLFNTSSTGFLRGRVSILDSNGKVVQDVYSTNPGADITISLKGLAENKVYTIRVQGAEGGPFGIGAYKLAVGNRMSTMFASFNTMFSNGLDQFEQNLVGNNYYIDFGKIGANKDARWDVVGKAQFTSATEVDTYQLMTMKNAGDTMLISVWGDSNIAPQIRVFDPDGRELEVEVLRGDNLARVVQIRGIGTNMRYTIRTSAGKWNDTAKLFGKADYNMAVDIRQTPIDLKTIAMGTLTKQFNTSDRVLDVSRSQVFRFEITADSSVNNGSGAELTILDASGKTVFTIRAEAGETIASDVFLAPGKYTVRISGFGPSGTLTSTLNVMARFTALTDPIGPALLDPNAPLSSPTQNTSLVAKTEPVPVSPPATTSPPASISIDLSKEESGYLWDPIYQDSMFFWW